MDKRMISLQDTGAYFYSTQKVELSNPLGVIIATLTEYIITFKEKQEDVENPVVSLFKTKDGNWYEPHNYPAHNLDHAQLLSLKAAIDEQEQASRK